MRRAAPLRLTVCMTAVAALAAVGTLLAPAAQASDSLLPPQPSLRQTPAPAQVPGVPTLGRKWQ